MTEAAASVPWPILLPLAGALLSLLGGRRGPGVALLAALATAGSGVVLASHVRAHGAVLHAVGGWAAPLGIALHADGAGTLMLATFGIVGALVGAHAFGHFPAGPRRSAFFTFGLFGWAALDALLLSADAFNLYVALELLTLAAVGLISLDGGRPAASAALRYLLVSLLGSLGYLIGIALLYALCGALDIPTLGRRLRPGPVASTALVLMTSGLGLKAALFPLHAWLPPAYRAAPAPVTALLSAFVGKAPFIVLFRIGLETFPVALGPAALQVLGAHGAAGVLWASLLALRQRRLKTMLVYSSVAHVGYLFLVFPLGTDAARAGAVYLVISHAAASAAMFTAAGTLERTIGTDSLEALSGVAHRYPITFFALGLGGLGLMGLPPTGGFIAKWLLVRAALECGQWWWAVLVVVGGLIAAGYVFRILRGAFVAPAQALVAHPPRGSEVVPLVLALVAFALGVAPSFPLALMGGGPS